jgi:MFS family permease
MLDRARRFFRSFETSFWILVVGWFVAALGFASSIPFISIYFHGELGLSTSEIGLFFGAMAIVRSVFQAIGGEMSDRVERRWMLVHSQTFRALSFLFLGLAIAFHWGFWIIAALFTINSIFGSIFMPAVNALVADMLPAQKRLDGYAVARSASNLGWAVGPAIGGFLAKESYASLFYSSAVLMLGSAMIFRYFLHLPKLVAPTDKFKVADLLAVKDDRNLAWHAGLTLILYLVVAQLIAPFSVYSVEMVGISEARLGILFTLNGLMVVLFQIVVTRLLRRFRFTTQLAWGSFLYFIGYGMVGMFVGFDYFVMAICVVSLGEVVMSPPGLTLTSHLAPKGRVGRYMGVRGFFETAGWSLGPLYGGIFLDKFAQQPAVAWLLISSLALVAGVGYLIYGRILPRKYNIME